MTIFPNIYILFIVWLSIIAYIWYSIFLSPKILLPQSSINQNKKLLRNTNKYIYILLSIIIPLNIYIPYTSNRPNIIITIDSSLSMSATDLQPSRSEYISNLINKSITTLPNKFTINTFATNIYDIAKYISSDQIPQNLKTIKLQTWSALGDALIYDNLLLSNNDNNILILATDWWANVWYDHHQALYKISWLQKPIILLAIYNTWYKIATSKNWQDIYISSDTWFINTLLSNPINSWIIINESNQNSFIDGKILSQIITNYNSKYHSSKYIYINYIIWLIWLLQSIFLIYTYLIWKIKK